ncbi:hypothetical protein [Rhizobium ruizarguesonis]|uniref:hypothetical protein n=1 Tax=Rhizobium ruizarguesonis TaxID=2081791 RepID=UPI001030EFBE|nr:hypothetical protein [Rhizobium ruizarguesonis]TBD80694.1 hypothetical protein ELH11_12705 [Rhizobium ruizarguesonis]TBE11855.1 hypothetical protein ELH09_12780 [Rhizobium ruizarguesonis]TBE23738.1 hypothetical protein ELH08_13010 [Rhizobium ruizarguesonis]TBE33579.1 hypothetical protein ELH07_13480 [Rhizobium ruizarguesonis]WSG99927.1 hypothetical protein U8P71_14975 [Rhizobium ruizarguesonis]
MDLENSSVVPNFPEAPVLTECAIVCLGSVFDFRNEINIRGNGVGIRRKKYNDNGITDIGV